MSEIKDCENLAEELENTSSDDLHSKCVELGEDVMAGRIKLVKIVELLRPLLINTDNSVREKGVSILAEIMGALKPDYLSEEELHFLTQFFCDRMKDHHSIASAVLRGVLALIDMNNLPSDSPILICTALFSHIHCQTLTQPERNMVYRIFQKFLSSRIDDLKPLGIDFVLGFITAIDSERDPNNLMLLFSIIPRFLSSFPLLHLAEEVFSVISCYFPIDFNAAAEENQTNTREDLASALAPCLISAPQFAEFCIPLVLEKLDSSLRIAKLDSLHVLKEGCKIWPVDLLEPNLVDIWLSLKKELLPGSDVDVRNSAGETLVVLLCKLNSADDDDKKTTILTSFVNDIISSTSGLLSDMNLSLFGPAVHILVTASSASEFVCKKVVSYVVPKLYELPQTSSQDTVIVIRTLNLFLKAQLKFTSNTPNTLNNVDVCGEVWSLLPDMLLSAAVTCNYDVQAAAFDGLSTLTPYLSDSNRNLVYKHSESALSNGNELVRNSCLKCLKLLAALYPLEVMNNLVKSKLLIDKGCPDIDKHKWRVETLCSFLMLLEFTEPISNILLNVIEEFSPITPIILFSIRNLLENSDLNEPAIRLLCTILTKRLAVWLLNGVHQSNYSEKFCNEDILTNSAAVIECLIRPQDSSLQYEIVSPLIKMVVPIEETGNGLHNCIKDNTTIHLCSKVVLLEGLLESIHQEVIVPDWQMLTTSLSSIAFSSSHYLTQLSASRLLANLMNKQQNDEGLASVLGHVAKMLEERLKDKSTEVNAVRLLSWITKALVLRGHSLMSYWLDKLTEQLSNRRIGKEAADGFRLVMSEDSLHLTTRSHCTVRILYKQRLFQRIQSLVSASRSCLPNCKVNYLMAIAHFVQAVPRVVLLPYLRQVVLPMVESLDYDDDRLELITLQTLSSLLSEKEPALESYMDTFIPRCLTLAQQSPFMKVRVTALECIRNYGNYPPILLMPYVQTVIYELEACLDDKKRLVRKSAVEARSKWFLIGAPTDDD